jgi:serine phosphatase RsbU (regulator of sigma subunit)
MPAELAPALLRAVEAHARDSRFTDDLTVLILKRPVIT